MSESMLSYTGAPQLLPAGPRAERRDACASARRLHVAQANVGTALPHRPMTYNRKYQCSIMLGSFTIFIGCVTSVGVFIGIMQGNSKFGFTSRLLPILVIPAIIIIAGIITIVATVCRMRKAAERQFMNLRLAPRQAQSAFAQSFAWTTDIGSAPCRSCGHNSASDGASCSQFPDATSTSTITGNVNHTTVCKPTIYMVQFSDDAPPSYAAATQEPIYSSYV